MEPADDPSNLFVEPTQTLARPLVMPYSRRYDLGVVTITALTGIVSGSVLTLAYLMAASTQELVILGALILVAGASVVLTIRYRDARQTAAITQWAQQIKTEQPPTGDTALESTHTRADENEQLDPSPTTPGASEEPFVATHVPLIFGWEALGLAEAEISPQLPILAALFQGQPQVHLLRKFSGGHRNRGVYHVRAADEADRIVKIARSADIRAERRAQQLIDRFSQNNGGQYVRAVSSAHDDEYGGIVYRLASLRRNTDIKSFDTFYRETQDPATCAAVIEQVYSEALPHSQFRHVQRMALFQEYTFFPGKLNKLSDIAISIPLLENDMLATESVSVMFGNSPVQILNPLHWAANIMPNYSHLQMPAVCGVIHGDLHSGNLLVETPGHNVWIIDFSKTRAGAHTLADFARLEADLKFALLPSSENEDYFEQALRFEKILLSPQIAQEMDMDITAFGGLGLEFQKAAASILALRRVAVNHQPDVPGESIGHFADASVLPYFLALFHTSLRTLKHEQSNPAQKTYAFVAAGLLCERIHRLVSRLE